MVAVIGDAANHPSTRLHQADGVTHPELLPAIGLRNGTGSLQC
jgi:hypothetical protein